MSFNAPLFSFFDAISNEVENFNRSLGNSDYYDFAPNHQLVSSKEGNDGQQVSKSRDFDDFFGNHWSSVATNFASSRIMPPVDVLEHEKEYELDVAVPGIKDKKDIEVEYHAEKNQIVITGEVPSTVTEENENKVRVREVITGKFQRVIALPKSPGVEPENIKADYASGVLKVMIPKLEAAEREDGIKKIEISSQNTLQQ